MKKGKKKNSKRLPSNSRLLTSSEIAAPVAVYTHTHLSLAIGIRHPSSEKMANENKRIRRVSENTQNTGGVVCTQ